MPGPLAGMKVLDMSRILAGPWLTQILSDMGAEVWKIERPGSGDDTRHWGPPYLRDNAGNETPDSAYFQAANRGKKSICVDIKSEEGREVVQMLAAKADVFVENYKVGDLARFGLSFEDIKQIRPSIVYCSITGYGQTGPYKNRAGYDMAIQAISGLMSMTGEKAYLPGGGPQKVGVPIADLMTGTLSSAATIAAYHHAKNTGVGQHIDMALFDVMVSSLANQNMNYLIGGEIPQTMGNAHPNIAPYQVFQTKDSSFVLAVGNDRQYRKFCDVAECPELVEDVRFVTTSDRLGNREALTEKLQSIIVMQTTDFWVQSLSRSGVPCSPINNLRDVFDNEQIRHRGLQITGRHKNNCKLPLVGSPIKFSETAVDYQNAPPVLNEHRDYILDEVLGLSSSCKQRLTLGIPE
ncbi:MAG: CoA transferase [Blastopirellula sp.]|nr:MAG: CoA transferase [Blastopirellula sp.]